MKAKRNFLSYALVLLFAFCANFSNAQTVIYRFDPPQLVVGQSTPFLNLLPDVGPTSFLASFTAPSGGAFNISTFAFPNFSGQTLIDPGYPADTLRVTLNTPITDVQLDFALGLPSSHLQFQCFTGTTNVNQLPSTQYGSLAFHSAVPFTQFDLSGFNNNSNASMLLAIDNLVMTLVPEPSASLLIIAGYLAVIFTRHRNRKKGLVL